MPNPSSQRGLQRLGRALLSSSHRPTIGPAFSLADSETVFKTRTSAELVRAYLVFRACTVQPLVKNAARIITLSTKVFGPALTSFVIRHSFFAHFCAGEDARDIAPSLSRLRRAGIGGILDYAAEADLPSEGGKPRKGVAALRPSAADAAEANLDRNLAVTIKAIEAAASVHGAAAVKLTGIAQPELLQRVSGLLHDHRRAFRRFNVDLLPSPYTDLRVGPELFRRLLAGPRLAPGEVDDLFRAVNHAGDGSIDFIQWVDFLALLRLGGEESRIAAAQVKRHMSPEDLVEVLTPGAASSLDSSELTRWRSVLRRADELARAAVRCKVVIMVDAEQTYLQPAIDWVTTEMQRRHNRHDALVWRPPEARHVLKSYVHQQEEFTRAAGVASLGAAPSAVISDTLRPLSLLPPPAAAPTAPATPFVFSTFQAYLVDAVPRLRLALARAEREGWTHAAKLVRGAYMHQERARAAALGYADPIHGNIEGTHAAYRECSELLLAAARDRGAAVLFATHNTDSVLYATARMQELGLPPRSDAVSFGQLLGMCDHLTYSLAASQYRAFKYVPYGPVQEVIPYLLRRAQENSDLLSGGVAQELALLRTELAARARGRSRS